MSKAIIADTETTSIKNPEVLQFSYLELDEFQSSWPIKEFWFSSKEPCEYGALATHHILEEEVAGRPCYDLGSFPAGLDYMIAHNVDFDHKALGQPKVRLICTLAIARRLYPSCDSHSLGALCYYLLGSRKETKELLADAHAATADVVALWHIFGRIVADSGVKTLDELYAFSEDARIPKIMTFGKYKDQPITAVDRGWYNWYRRQSDTDPYLLEAFKRAGF